MTRSHPQRAERAGLHSGLAPALILTAALTVTATASAQPLSSGSGAGTGTGTSGGTRNSTGTTNELPSQGLRGGTSVGPSRGGRLLNPPRLSPGASIPAGPGIGSSLPGETPMIPLDSVLTPGLPQNASEYAAVSEIHYRFALQIPSAGDRSLALSRIASTATFGNQLDMAERAVVAAASSALLIPQGLVRNQRLISTVSALLDLAEARIREGVESAAASVTVEDRAAPLPKVDRQQMIERAQTDWRLAADLARKVDNPTYRNELMFRVADGMAAGSQSIESDFPRTDDAPARGSGSGSTRPAAGSTRGLPDQILGDASALAQSIDRPVWRDRALVSVASLAAQSRQFARATAIARMIPQPEVRIDALLRIAENQARKNDQTGATASYEEAARAVASIPVDDVRAVLAGVLIDNLISVGRFDDARSAVVLYPDQARKMTALGAIAEGMGRRGVAQAALAWINTDVPPESRSYLYRRVSNGVVSSIVNNRTNRDLSK